jgi:uncharacterized caspase-like protein
MLLLSSLLLAAPPPIDTPRPSGLRSRKDAALVVSVEDYEALPDATKAASDAAAMAAWLRGTRGVERVVALSNPSAAALRRGLGEAARGVRRGGTLWLYFAGHGAVTDAGGRVLLAAEARPGRLAEGSVLLSEVVGAAASSRARQSVVLVDASFGPIGRSGEEISPKLTVPSLPTARDRVSLWLAGTGAEPASLYPDAGHGMFTYFAIGALRGWADGALGGASNGSVSLEEAQTWTQRTLRSVGGRGWNPSVDSRTENARWELVRGTLEPGPDKDTLTAMAQAEKTRRVKEAQERVQREAKNAWVEVGAATAKVNDQNLALLKEFVEHFELATVTVDGVDVAVVVPEVAEARARMDAYARAKAKASGKKKKKVRNRQRSAVVAPMAGAWEACADLVRLEPAAMSGTLTPESITCIEGRISSEPKQTTRDKLSRVLLANADARSDLAEWTRLAARHLEQVDRSDPDLCFRYALTLSRNEDASDGDEVLKWVDYALENKQNWQGPTYMSRVYNLFRLRAEVATRLWQDAEQDFIEERTEEDEAESERCRGLAKNAAKEWLDYARASGQSPARALSLCESASGSPDFCAGPPADVWGP